MHAGIAGGLGALMVLTAALTLLPGPLPLPGAGVLMGVGLAATFPLFGVAIVRGFVVPKEEQWPAFRCLPGWVQLTLALLLGAGIAVNMVRGEEVRGQDAQIRDGRYQVFVTAQGKRGWADVGRDEYLRVRESDQRSALAIPGTLLAGAATLSLITGEARRA